jgi:hypothetical protein
MKYRLRRWAKLGLLAACAMAATGEESIDLYADIYAFLVKNLDVTLPAAFE